MIKESTKKSQKESVRSKYQGKGPSSRQDSSYQPNIAFEHGRIIQHYRRLKQRQHEELATINMPQDLKRKLFGFSEGYYLVNKIDNKNLIVEDHPLKGKIIMTKDKYQHYLIQKFKQKQIKSNKDINSLSNIYTDNKNSVGSDLEAPYNNIEHMVNETTYNQLKHSGASINFILKK